MESNCPCKQIEGSGKRARYNNHILEQHDLLTSIYGNTLEEERNLKTLKIYRNIRLKAGIRRLLNLKRPVIPIMIGAQNCCVIPIVIGVQKRSVIPIVIGAQNCCHTDSDWSAETFCHTDSEWGAELFCHTGSDWGAELLCHTDSDWSEDTLSYR
jgi:hypothetical protein